MTEEIVQSILDKGIPPNDDGAVYWKSTYGILSLDKLTDYIKSNDMTDEDIRHVIGILCNNKDGIHSINASTYRSNLLRDLYEAVLSISPEIKNYLIFMFEF